MAGSEREARESEDLPDGVLSVGELNERISERIDAAESLQDVQVTGEVVDCSESNVALYFTLTDGTHSVECMLWKRDYADMDVEIADGLEVLLAGGVDFWPEGGTLSLKPWLVHPIGDGAQHAALERLRTELEDRGWFDDTYKQPLPTYPTTVGVVTSKNGDARHDVQDAIHRRYPDVDVVVEHASVQGENAPPELATGVACLDEDPDVDVVIVGRGGGGDDDLMAFNTELVAEAIFHASTPVVAAVGHREDVTIADAVADHSAITPTAAGEAVVREKATVLAEVADYRATLLDAFEDRATDEVTALEERLEETYETTVARRLDALATGLSEAYHVASSSRLAALRTDLDAAYRAVEHEHDKQAAVEAARADAAGVPTAYKVAVVVLATLLALAIIALILT